MAEPPHYVSRFLIADVRYRKEHLHLDDNFYQPPVKSEREQSQQSGHKDLKSKRQIFRQQSLRLSKYIVILNKTTTKLNINAD